MELERFQRLAKQWERSGHPCGKGSLPENTAEAAKAILDAIETVSAKSVIDFGCGLSEWEGVKARRLDMIKWDEGVEVHDFTKDRIPKCDLAVFRFVLIHHTEDTVSKVLEAVKKQAKAALVTTFPESEDTGGGDYWKPDIARFLGEPTKLYPDHDSYLGLWVWR